jgi:hypothetical protein
MMGFGGRRDMRCDGAVGGDLRRTSVCMKCARPEAEYKCAGAIVGCCTGDATAVEWIVPEETWPRG